MRRKKKVEVRQDPFVTIRKINPAVWNYPVGDSESQYTENAIMVVH